jgi:peptidoglycan/xylan/chitin deacetylase (PgdA/CDA1 family)/ketosteroid isomerase-like protein
VTARPSLVLSLLLVVAAVGRAAEAPPPRPLLVTVDDLPIAGGRGHDDPEERRRITEGLLGHLERHGIQAVGLVTWRHVRDDGDRALLERWLAAGHELGNHSHSHPNYTTTPFETYREDMDRARRELEALLEPHDLRLRFFRFPFLREGDTPEKVAAMRRYLEETGQRNLPVTLDNQDWSYNTPWSEARGAGDAAAAAAVAEDYHAALRISVRHHERRGDRLLGRTTPQILLLHANAIGAAEWGRLFEWLEKTGHRFARADEVLSEPTLADPPAVVAPYGYGAWDRLWQEQGAARAREAGTGVLEAQAEAWNAGDLEAFCSAYAEDAVYASSTGLTRGREAILERYRQRYPNRAGMGTLSFDVVEARPASGVEITMLGDAAPSRVHGVSVVARWRLTYSDREPVEGLTLIVLRRRGDGWEMVQDASL